MPNVTFHTLSYPFEMDEFWAMQWPMLWADNFTTARHIMVFDADTPLVLPLRCHHLFDERALPVWRSWETNLAWTRTSDAIMPPVDRRERGYDFMTFFPVVIPRQLLGETRDVLRAACRAGTLDGVPGGHHPKSEETPGIVRGAALREAGGCDDFDRVYMALGRVSYGDLLGKCARAASVRRASRTYTAVFGGPYTNSVHMHSRVRAASIT